MIGHITIIVTCSNISISRSLLAIDERSTGKETPWKCRKGSHHLRTLFTVLKHDRSQEQLFRHRILLYSKTNEICLFRGAMINKSLRWNSESTEKCASIDVCLAILMQVFRAFKRIQHHLPGVLSECLTMFSIFSAAMRCWFMLMEWRKWIVLMNQLVFSSPLHDETGRSLASSDDRGILDIFNSVLEKSSRSGVHVDYIDGNAWEKGRFPVLPAVKDMLIYDQSTIREAILIKRNYSSQKGKWTYLDSRLGI